MAGVYIHIPFCKKACHYCNFHFSTSIGLQKPFIAAIIKEIELQKEYLKEGVSTIYFGGGTPSLLASSDIKDILDKIYATWNVDANAEITLEANPDDIVEEKSNDWKSIGINRLSIGVQSFFEEDLLWMNRAHTSTQAIECINIVRDTGFDNFTIDLIYGTPTLSDNNWKKNVETALALHIPHLSCYALTVEPKTALEKMIEKKTVANVNPETQAKHFELLMSWMQQAGYEHYEISNFAKPGYRSKHNSSYWQGKPYIGLGPSAHSFNGHSRQWNIANNALYIQGLENNSILFEKELLTKSQQLNEYIMTSLRTIEGISLQKLQVDFGDEYYNHVVGSAVVHIQNEHLINDGNYIRTSLKGKLYADGIAADLFV